MSKALSATDLMPLVFKLTPNERLKLARLARRAATVVDDASAYRAFPPAPDEFALADEPMAWEADDWSEFTDSR